MKTSTICAIVLAFLPFALSCCKQDKLTSCCGKGKCNIFCCNCKGGCKPKEQCKGMDLPICWGVGAPGRPVVICTKSLRSSDELRDASDGSVSAEDFFRDMDAETEAAGLANLEAAGFTGPEGDEKIFLEVDTDGKGHFTYEEFVSFTGAEDEPELKAYFDRFDKNSDGVITVDEMRETVDDSDDPTQQNPRQSGKASHEEL